MRTYFLISLGVDSANEADAQLKLRQALSSENGFEIRSLEEGHVQMRDYGGGLRDEIVPKPRQTASLSIAHSESVHQPNMWTKKQ